MDKSKSIYDLELHEETSSQGWYTITRVPGGWIYELRRPSSNILESVFVPYSDEFKPKENE